MFAKILKFILWLVLLTCLLWAIAIFAGPTVISGFISRNFGEAVKVYGLKVSPRLEVYASLLEIQDLTVGQNRVVSGEIRAVSLMFDGFSGVQPHFSFSVGPSSINGYGKIEAISGNVTPQDILEQGKFFVQLNIQNMNLNEELGFEEITLSADYLTSGGNFSNLNIYGEKLFFNSEVAFTAEHFNGRVNTFLVKQDTPYILPDFTAELKRVNYPIGATRIDNITLSGTNLEENYELTMKSDAISLPYLGMKVEHLAGNLIVEDWGISPAQLDLNLVNVTLPTEQGSFLQGEISNINLIAESNSNSELSAKIKAELGHVEVIDEDQFVANLSGSNIFTEIVLNYDASVDDVNFKSNFHTISDPKIEVTARGNIFSPIEKLLKCVTSMCIIPRHEIHFHIGAEDAALSGNISCKIENCDNVDYTVLAETDDTASFFDSIGRSRVLNPFLNAYFFSQFLQGEPIGNGHRIKFY